MKCMRKAALAMAICFSLQCAPHPALAAEALPDSTVRIAELEERIEALEAENKTLLSQISEYVSYIRELERRLSIYEPNWVGERSITEPYYIVNTNSGKIHRPDGPDVELIADEHRAIMEKPLDQLLDEGFTTCKRCFD